MNLQAYFFFNGNCNEALEAYAQALNGQVVEVHHYAEYKDKCKQLPESWHNKIIHATFRAGDISFMAADIPPQGSEGFTVTPATSPISLSLNFNSEAEQTTIFNNLAAGGTITMALHDTFWGARFGMLTDKFGIKWMFNYDKPQV